MSLLEVSHDDIAGSRETKCKLKADITTERRSATESANRAFEPDLRHAKDGAHDAKAEGGHGGNSRRQLVPVEVVFWTISRHAALVDDMLGECDAFVDGEPVGDEQHEVLQDIFKMIIARDGNSYVDECANECPDEPRNASRCASEELEGQRDRIDIRAVVCNDGKGEDD